MPKFGGPWKGVCNTVKKDTVTMRTMQENVRKRVGKDMKTLFWLDVWVGEKSLRSMLPRLFAVACDPKITVEQMGFWDGEDWRWVFQWRRELFVWEGDLRRKLEEILLQVHLIPGEKDAFVWGLNSNGELTTRSLCKKLSEEKRVLSPMQFVVCGRV